MNRGSRGRQGKKAGYKDKVNGYLQIRIDGKLYVGHILAWFYMTGEWPLNQIDHKDRNRGNDKYQNIRPANYLLQRANSSLRSDNTTGYKGVSYYKSRKKWTSTIHKNKIRYILGYFNCPIEAAKAYDKKAIEFFGEYAALNFPGGKNDCS